MEILKGIFKYFKGLYYLFIILATFFTVLYKTTGFNIVDMTAQKIEKLTEVNPLSFEPAYNRYNPTDQTILTEQGIFKITKTETKPEIAIQSPDSANKDKTSAFIITYDFYPFKDHIRPGILFDSLVRARSNGDKLEPAVFFQGENTTEISPEVKALIDASNKSLDGEQVKKDEWIRGLVSSFAFKKGELVVVSYSGTSIEY